MRRGGERSRDVDLNRKELHLHLIVKMRKESEVDAYDVILGKDGKSLSEFTRGKPTCPARGSLIG